MASLGLEKLPGLADVSAWASEDEIRLACMLIESGQGHLFEKWVAGEAVEKKHAFFEQVRSVERNYPGGCAAYSTNARELLRSSAAGENPFENMKPEMPELHRYEYGTPAFAAQEEFGLSVVKDAAFVLVAGGLGERLGYSGIKLSLPVQSLTEQSYLELYIAQILTMQAKAGCAPLPLAIMTSDDTHARTVALLEEHANFGAAPGQVTLIKQEKVPALLDNLARFATEGDAYTLETKPHGHGDVHTLLASSGLAEAWQAAGRRYIVFFQDTNALCFTVTIAALGISAQAGLDLNSIAVPRKAKDAVGAITKLVRPDGSTLTINVEYNQLEPMLKSSGYPEGDVNGADGFSPFPGNINQLIFALPCYVDTLKRTGGLVPEFVNPKYADASKTRFKKPTRLECMMQDLPKVFPAGARVAASMFDDWTYSPVKNSQEEAQAKLAGGSPGRSALEGEFEYYAAASHALRAAGVAIPPPASFAAGGITVPRLPAIVVAPTFANSLNDWKARFPTPAAVSITPRSSLHIAGAGAGAVVIQGLALDGALEIHAGAGARVTIRSLSVTNAGVEFVPLAAGQAEPDWVKIRAFTCQKKEVRRLAFPEAGEFVVAE